MNITLMLGIIVAWIALLFCIISTAIPYWWSFSNGNTGLFRGCVEFRFGSACADFKDAPDWLEATRAVMILSILALGASLLLAILFGFVVKDKQILALGAAFMSIAAGGLALLGAIIYATKNPYTVGNLHAGFGLAIIAAMAAGVAGVILFLSKNRNMEAIRPNM